MKFIFNTINFTAIKSSSIVQKYVFGLIIFDHYLNTLKSCSKISSIPTYHLQLSQGFLFVHYFYFILFIYSFCLFVLQENLFDLLLRNVGFNNRCARHILSETAGNLFPFLFMHLIFTSWDIKPQFSNLDHEILQ